MKSPVTITVETARNGQQTARTDTRYLYSQYDPGRETERFVRARITSFLNTAGRHPSCVILVSEGLGHLEEACSRYLPDCRIISIHLTEDLSSLSEDAAAGVLTVIPERHRSVGTGTGKRRPFSERTFESLTSEVDISELLVIEWEPSVQALEHEYEVVRDTFERVLRRRAADSATVKRWGRLWIRNILRNCTRSRLESQLPLFGNRPTLVVCPGPTSSMTLEPLADVPQRPVIIALASALELLNHYGIPPDLIVHSDAGYYATLQFRAAWGSRMRRSETSSLIMPLTAAPPPLTGRAVRPTVSVISGNSTVEQHILNAIGIDAPVIPEAGTVTATALRVASSISEGPRFVAGLDLCLDDIRHHASPHAFDTFLKAGSNRFHPELSSRVNRILDTHRSDNSRTRRAANLDVYAEWFRSRTEEFSSVYRIRPTEVDTGMTSATVSALLTAANRSQPSAYRTRKPVKGNKPYQAAKPATVDRKAILDSLIRTVSGEGSEAHRLRSELARWLRVAPEPNPTRNALLSLYHMRDSAGELS